MCSLSSIKYLSSLKILSPRNLFYATKGFSLQNKIIVVVLIAIIVGSFLWWLRAIYHYTTVPVPRSGGHYIGALVGQPRYLNPLLSHSSAVDQSLAQLIFDGLFHYDENGLLQPDLAERYEMSEDAKQYTVYLRHGVLWHDGEPFTANDVLYTVGIVQNIAYSAVGVNNDLRLLWQGVRVEKIDDYVVRFILEQPNSFFLHSLTLGMIPEHIWVATTPEQFRLSEYNQSPIGTGPYRAISFDVSNNLFTAYRLRANDHYFKSKPLITRITFRFYATRDEATTAFRDGTVSGVVVDKKEHIDLLRRKSVQEKSIQLPHYFAVFFNQSKSVPLAYDEVREALSRATNRDAIIRDVFSEMAMRRLSPFAVGVTGFDADVQQPDYDPESANILLEEKGWKRGNDGIRVKGQDRLAFALHISGDVEQFVKTAEMLRDQWTAVGADVQIVSHEKNDLETNTIKPRDYDALLYAHQMRFEPNLMPLWSSKEKNDPGMNYALFADKAMDDALLLAVESISAEDRMMAYKKQQEQLKAEDPAVFLFAPMIAYFQSDSIKGMTVQKVNTSYDRFTNVEKWYIKEKRVLKRHTQ